MSNSQSGSGTGRYNCPYCSWMGDDPTPAMYDAESRCPKCGIEVSEDV